ncbi:MAG: DUF1801 domain-containing protein [Bryobacteraceae bacterium]
MAEKKLAGTAEAAAKIAAMPEHYRPIGERLHAIVMRSAPELQPTLWYGMPAYAKGGKVICFFRSDKYVTFGLTENANHALAEDAPHRLRESAWFFSEIDEATEAKLAAIVRKAAGLPSRVQGDAK